MTHKVHPKIFRIKRLSDWASRWFSKKRLPEYLEEDFKIREFLEKKLKKTGVEKIEIERFSGGKLNVIIFSARPGLLIGRGGQGIELLKKSLEKKFFEQENYALQKRQKQKRELRLEVRDVKNSWSSATLSAQWIAQQIESRVRYRRVLKQALGKITTQKGVEGCRVEVAGRLDGSMIARREWLKKGRLPRQTIRADIDYAKVGAFCTYGVIGVKVWIYKGEKFE
ncbi:30S ribosomal protein S3 [Patescibacteria group bacterium]|nr:30S ribosomal protein S3 [Patescibacteria group bacterium]